jgi:hypothetical protein
MRPLPLFIPTHTLPLALVAAIALSLGSPSHAQSSCADPFAGGAPPFGTDFWSDTDFCRTGIDFAEVISTGPNPLDKPVVTEPRFADVAAASDWLDDAAPVAVLTLGGEARAYPLDQLVWQEIVNDRLGDVPVAVTYCPLCDTVRAFVREADGTTLELGLTRNLHRGNPLMWDDATGSWWQQLSGEAVVGSLLGTRLERLPVQLASFAAFRSAFPNGQVLTRETGIERAWGTTPYAGFDRSPFPGLYRGPLDDRLGTMDRVLGIEGDAGSLAVPYALLAEVGALELEVDGEPAVALWLPGLPSALDQQQIIAGRDIGMAALFSRTLPDGRVLALEPEGTGFVDSETGSRWNIFGRAVDGPLAGSRLTQLVATPALWYSWAALNETAVLGE